MVFADTAVRAYSVLVFCAGVFAAMGELPQEPCPGNAICRAGWSSVVPVPGYGLQLAMEGARLLGEPSSGTGCLFFTPNAAISGARSTCPDGDDHRSFGPAQISSQGRGCRGCDWHPVFYRAVVV